MQKLLDWVKEHAAEGADVAEFQELYNKTHDAGSLIERQDIKAELDRRITSAVQRHDERFREEKLPSLVEQEREKLRSELNPEETPEQKRIRELEEKLSKADKERTMQQRREAVKRKASELGLTEIGLSPEDVEPFAGFGEDAESVLESFASKFTTTFQAAVDSKVKERFGDAPPKADKGKEPEPYDMEKRMANTFLG